MLILSRKAGQSLVIDGGLRISVLATDGRTVRLGIEAPSDIRVLRAEIVAQIEHETVAARASGAAMLALAPIKTA